jgi:hypothetical protein
MRTKPPGRKATRAELVRRIGRLSRVINRTKGELSCIEMGSHADMERVRIVLRDLGWMAQECELSAARVLGIATRP